MINSKQCNIKVNGDTDFTYQNEDNLLIALEKQNIDVHYHCREGFCGACRTKLISGNVDYIIDPLAFIDDDEVLVCCCVPKGNVELQTF